MLNTLINFTLLVPLLRTLSPPNTGSRFTFTLYLLLLISLWLYVGYQHLSEHPFSPNPGVSL